MLLGDGDPAICGVSIQHDAACLRPHLCWPACCCCTASPSVGPTARGKCAVWAGSSGSGAASARSGWWCSPESGRWSCRGRRQTTFREKNWQLEWVAGNTAPPTLLTHSTGHCAASYFSSYVSGHASNYGYFRDFSCCSRDYMKLQLPQRQWCLNEASIEDTPYNTKHHPRSSGEFEIYKAMPVTWFNYCSVTALPKIPGCHVCSFSSVSSQTKYRSNVERTRCCCGTPLLLSLILTL